MHNISIDDQNDRVKKLNQQNEWLRFLQTGESKEPYLKNKLKSRPEPMYVSEKQRRIFNGG